MTHCFLLHLLGLEVEVMSNYCIYDTISTVLRFGCCSVECYLQHTLCDCMWQSACSIVGVFLYVHIKKSYVTGI